MMADYQLLFTISLATIAGVGSMNRDPADWPENSYHPDIAEAVDSPADRCLEAAVKFWKVQGVPRDRIELAQGTARFALEFSCQGSSQTQSSKEKDERVSRILAAVIDSRDAALLTAQCIDYVVGTNVQGSVTEASIGRRHGITRAAVSKRCILLCEELGLDPGPGMRKLSTRRKYRLRQRGRRARSMKPRWGFASLLREVVYG